MAAKYAITGASGQLGRLILDVALEKKLNPADFVGLARKPSVLDDYKTKGFDIRELDYTKPETFPNAFAGVEKIVLISSTVVGERLKQHKAVIDFVAAQEKPAQLIYTSLLHADISKLTLAEEHKATEEYIKQKLQNYIILRNGWYTENYVGGLAQLIEGGQKAGASKQGKIAAAARKDYAEAAVAVLVSDDDNLHRNKIYELAGDEAFNLDEFTNTVSQLVNKPFKYIDLPENDYAALLQQFGLPDSFAKILAQSDAQAANGELYDDTKQLSQLIGRPTTPLKDVLKQALELQ